MFIELGLLLAGLLLCGACCRICDNNQETEEEKKRDPRKETFTLKVGDKTYPVELDSYLKPFKIIIEDHKAWRERGVILTRGGEPFIIFYKESADDNHWTGDPDPQLFFRSKGRIHITYEVDWYWELYWVEVELREERH